MRGLGEGAVHCREFWSNSRQERSGSGGGIGRCEVGGESVVGGVGAFPQDNPCYQRETACVLPEAWRLPANLEGAAGRHRLRLADTQENLLRASVGLHDRQLSDQLLCSTQTFKLT